LACAAGADAVDAEAALEALAILGLEVPDDEPAETTDGTIPLPERNDPPGLHLSAPRPA
jgi:hypothetical protein